LSALLKAADGAFRVLKWKSCLKTFCQEQNNLARMPIKQLQIKEKEEFFRVAGNSGVIR
jgi:hypothetical protein